MMQNLSLVALISIVSSYLLVTVLIPKISWIVKSRDLIDRPDHRSSHKAATPTMAGVAFFFTLLFVINIIKTWDSNDIGMNLVAALGLMFAVGLKDDLVVSTPRAKIGSEILAIFFILFCNCLQVNSLHGFLGIGNIPIMISYVLITLMILTIVNSFNMIDGIDGLASSMGIAIFTVYGFIFYSMSLHFYFLLCLCLIGILLGYLRYNLSTTKKVFMGDTGSLIIGFCIGFLSLKFLATDPALLQAHSFNPENSLIIIAGIFFIPLFDTLRVIGVRLLQKKSPFSPDNNHIHHVMINSGLTHFQASLFLCFLNLGVAVIFISLSTVFNSIQMIVLYLFTFTLLLGVFHQLSKNVIQCNRFRHLISAIRFLF
ncbi:MraY family glycosyltransferase [Flaviramulus aquimarinus]|uniref:MraY family glycosyltransferase n=1 Tax=Flaviramulus aquimarinus TaxID=1170456 RepID=A0ABP9EPR8_9FLAO